MAIYTVVTTGGTRWDLVLASATFDAARSSSTSLVFDNGDGTFTELIGSGLTFDASGPTGGTFTQMQRVARDANGIITTTYDTITGFAALAAGVTAANALQYALYGNDGFTGSSGSDGLSGYGGNDTIVGGGDTDSAFYINAISTGYSISLVSNGVVSVNAGPANTGEGHDVLDATVEQVTFGGVTYTVKAGTTGADTITGTAGNDLFVGGGGNDTFTGNGGTDVAAYSGSFSGGYTLSISGSTVTVNGTSAGEGTDTLNNVAFVSFNGVVYSTALNAGDANANSLSGTSGNDILRGFGGNDTIAGGAGTDMALFSGGAGSYTFIVNADGSLRITGTDGTDRSYRQILVTA